MDGWIDIDSSEILYLNVNCLYILKFINYTQSWDIYAALNQQQWAIGCQDLDKLHLFFFLIKLCCCAGVQQISCCTFVFFPVAPKTIIADLNAPMSGTLPTLKLLRAACVHILTGAHTNTINKHAMCHSHRETFCTKPAPPCPPSPLWQTYRKEEIRSEQSSGEDVSPQEGQPERDKNKSGRDRNKMRLQRKRLWSAKAGRETQPDREIYAQRKPVWVLDDVFDIIDLSVFFKRTKANGSSSIF